jgi:hypothetical protein
MKDLYYRKNTICLSIFYLSDNIESLLMLYETITSKNDPLVIKYINLCLIVNNTICTEVKNVSKCKSE